MYLLLFKVHLSHLLNVSVSGALGVQTLDNLIFVHSLQVSSFFSRLGQEANMPLIQKIAQLLVTPLIQFFLTGPQP